MSRGLGDVYKRQLMDSTFKTTLSKELMDQRGYVLTPDFALKFMLLNHCRAAGQNVVLSGDTGTGKSELIEMLSMLVNLRSGAIPRSFEESCAHLEEYHTPLKAAKVPYARRYHHLCQLASCH